MTQYVLNNVKKMETPVTLWVACSLFVLLFALYIYFINGAIMLAVESKDINTEKAELVASMSDLETEYNALRSTISEEFAYGIGFTKPTIDAHFISLVGNTNVLSLHKGL
ncbi:MAG TPA: hypothetical protein PLB51_00360 [Candidatus Paceibacterota bacterium]|jgi:hypothetical protein|nr:hypothetical protein [Candidatus Paceibacterota bacterium]